MAPDELIPAPRLPAERRVALVVATSTYRDPEYPFLAAPTHDAATMTRMLEDLDVCGFEVRTLIDAPAESIRLAVHDLFDEERDPADFVLVYLSCHGAKDRRGRLYFVASDTESTKLAVTAVGARDLMERAEDCPARRQVIILDCCYSGAFDAKGVSPVDLLAESAAEEVVSGGRCIITASRGAEYSFQYRPGSGEITGSVFTTALTEGILTGQADVANNGKITVQDAYRYAHAAVRRYGRRQTPQFNIQGAEGASIVLARNPVGIRTGDSDLYELVALLDSDHVEVRAGAIRAFGKLLADENPAKAATARLNLERVMDTDTDTDLADLANETLMGGTRSAPPGDPARLFPLRRRPSPFRRSEPPAAAPSFVVGEPLTDEEIGNLRTDGGIRGSDEFSPVDDPLGVFAPRRVVPLEFEPSRLVSRYLYPTERYYGEWRRHWSEPLLAAALSGLTSGRATRRIDPDMLWLPPEILGVPTSTAITVALIAVAVLAGWRALAWSVWRVVLTNTRIMILRGILWQRMMTIPLHKQTTVRSSRSILGLLLGYGTLSVNSGRWRSYRIRHLPVPDEIVLRITEQVFDPDSAEARLASADDGED